MKQTQSVSRLNGLFKVSALWLASFSLAAVFTNACVTVNVHFPESAVQKATDDYVKDLYRAKEKGKTPTTSPAAEPAKQSRFSLINEAWAESEFSFTVSSPKAMQIREKMRARVDEVLAQKRAGFLGESADGLLVLRNKEKIKPLLLKKTEKLIAEENADRKELYQEVVKSNSMPANRMKSVEQSFARSFQAESPAGSWLEDAEGKWSQKQ